MSDCEPARERDIVFISKATPGDDEFALWLAPRLEAAGYKVFADVLSLEPGDRWRKEITRNLQDCSIKMLLCCRDTTLARDGVQEEIGIALDLSKSLKDPKFIIPLRLEPYKKLFGIGELQYTDFVRGWADGLSKLLDALKRQKVPCNKTRNAINPNWEVYRRRKAVAVKDEPERLMSNWLRVSEAPDVISFYEPTGAIDRGAVALACEASKYAAEPFGHGFFSFGGLHEINEAFSSLGKFSVRCEIPLMQFVEEGSDDLGLRGQDASNMVHSMFRQAWNTFCREKGLLEYRYSNAVGFHVPRKLAKIGERIPWGKQGERRWSMLRNIAKGQVWQFGVTAQPSFWPFPHFKLKSRVLFAPPSENDTAEPHDDAKKQHRLRRTVCKGWRNRQWYGRMLAWLELLSGESAFIRLPLGEDACIKLDASPILFTSPVSTPLPDTLSDDQEEEDISTLGRPEQDEEGV